MYSSSPSEEGIWRAPDRDSGLEAVGSIPWGTHFCQFYASKEELIATLVPYIKAGIEANELCIWLTSAALSACEAKAALSQAVPMLDRYLASKQIEIVDCSNWYDSGKGFKADKVLAGWAATLNTALERGFEGLRVTGDVSWLEGRGWKDFIDYEIDLDGGIGSKRMLTLCTYPLAKCGPSEILDVAAYHEFALVRRDGRWSVLENAAHRRVQREFKKFVSLADNSWEFIGMWDLDFVPSTSTKPA